MKVNIKTIDDTPLPEYETSGAVAFDLRARKQTVFAPQSLGLIPTGIVVDIPEGYMLSLNARSSTPKKKGLLIPHGLGIIDQDYCGDDDELLLQYYNFTDEPVTVEKGERCGQAVFIKIEKAQWNQVDSMDNQNRGGFGTTGHK